MKKWKKILLSTSCLLGLTAAGLVYKSNKICNAKSNHSVRKIQVRHRSNQGNYFIDSYKTNTRFNMTPGDNASIDLLSQMTTLWQPGTAWNNGKRLNLDILGRNISLAHSIALGRSDAQAQQAFLDDRNNPAYSVQEGLGNLTDYFRAQADVEKGYTKVPIDADDIHYHSYFNKDSSIGDPDSKLGEIVGLVDMLRDGNYSSSINAKNYYKYPRPFRWDGSNITNALDNGTMLHSLIPAAKQSSVNDYSFPSGHTNASYLTAFALAYAYPQRFQQLLYRASEVGNNRIVAGWHSPLDVMGGRTLGTALAAAILSDPDNKGIEDAAYKEAQKYLTPAHQDDNDYGVNDAQSNEQKYNYRMTYGFPKLNNVGSDYRVPMGAQILLKTRFPYLNSFQRRVILATTELQGKYPVIDDGEGWGRLNLYKAANGYGQLVSTTKVNMNAKKGGFNRKDSWTNTISGNGKLIKLGSGRLELTGNNTYTGGDQIRGGILSINSETALGYGNVDVFGGNLHLSNKLSQVNVKGNYHQTSAGITTIDSGKLKVGRKAILGGTLKLGYHHFHNGQQLISYKAHLGKFKKVIGLKNFKVVYGAHSVKVIK